VAAVTDKACLRLFPAKARCTNQVLWDSRRGGLFVESPEVNCHILGGHPVGVPIEEEGITAVPVALAGDAALIGI